MRNEEKEMDEYMVMWGSRGDAEIVEPNSSFYFIGVKREGDKFAFVLLVMRNVEK